MPRAAAPDARTAAARAELTSFRMIVSEAGCLRPFDRSRGVRPEPVSGFGWIEHSPSLIGTMTQVPHPYAELVRDRLEIFDAVRMANPSVDDGVPVSQATGGGRRNLVNNPKQGICRQRGTPDQLLILGRGPELSQLAEATQYLGAGAWLRPYSVHV